MHSAGHCTPGSESILHVAGTPQRAENKNINTSLTALQRVFNCLELRATQRTAHIPYRDSLLTQALQVKRPPACKAGAALRCAVRMTSQWGTGRVGCCWLLEPFHVLLWRWPAALGALPPPPPNSPHPHACRASPLKKHFPARCRRRRRPPHCPSAPRPLPQEGLDTNNARVVLCATVSPFPQDHQETRSTLDFASRARNVRTFAKVNVVAKPDLASQHSMLRSLQADRQVLLAENARLQQVAADAEERLGQLAATAERLTQMQRDMQVRGVVCLVPVGARA